MFGIVIGLPALRLKGDYLAIITLGFGEIIRVIILNLKFTGGAYGLKGIGRQTTVTWVYIFVLITIYVISALIKSRHGRAILSIREDEIAAEASGIPTTYYKALAFTVSAGFAGVAGGLYAHYLSILDPSTFGFMRSVEILVIVVLGGLGSIFGSVISAAVLTILPELLRQFEQYRMVIYSLLLVAVMIFKPSGLCGRYEFSLGDSIDRLCAAIRGRILKKGGREDAPHS
jgi:branched-chain amino acid transport system permease protein